METYLLVSGIIEVIITVLFTTTAIVTVYLNEEDTKTCIVLNVIPSVPLGLFLIAWNIVGAVVFWGHIYSLTNCSYQTSTYIFASLIIKFVSSSSLLNDSNKK